MLPGPGHEIQHSSSQYRNVSVLRSKTARMELSGTHAEIQFDLAETRDGFFSTFSIHGFKVFHSHRSHRSQAINQPISSAWRPSRHKKVELRKFSFPLGEECHCAVYIDGHISQQFQIFSGRNVVWSFIYNFPTYTQLPFPALFSFHPQPFLLLIEVHFEPLLPPPPPPNLGLQDGQKVLEKEGGYKMSKNKNESSTSQLGVTRILFFFSTDLAQSWF